MNNKGGSSQHKARENPFVMGSSHHISDTESESEVDVGNGLSSRNGCEWFSSASSDPEGLVVGWIRRLEQFLQNPCEVGRHFWMVKRRKLTLCGNRHGFPTCRIQKSLRYRFSAN